MTKRGILIGLIALAGCVPAPVPPQRFPALEYADRIKREQGIAPAGFRSAPTVQPATLDGARASIRPVSDELTGHEIGAAGGEEMLANVPPDSITNLGPNVVVHENRMPAIRDYTGPLSVGDAGQSASLWRESRGGNLLFRDYRAFQPMDLITIIVEEDATAKNKADTTVKQESTFKAVINKLFGLEDADPHHRVFPTAVDANTSSDYKGEGETNREGSLKARISGMVVEVLPSGVLRIEGEKIIVVNNEDQHMVLSGLVRPEDVTSRNEVSSSKIANVRIDYYGRGAVGDAQTGTWFGNMLRRFWPL